MPAQPYCCKVCHTYLAKHTLQKNIHTFLVICHSTHVQRNVRPSNQSGRRIASHPTPRPLDTSPHYSATTSVQLSNHLVVVFITVIHHTHKIMENCSIECLGEKLLPEYIYSLQQGCPYFSVLGQLLNPWSRVLLEKLTGLQLVKKFPTFYGTRRFITAFTSARHLSLS
jgi:hypothetical protein